MRFHAMARALQPHDFKLKRSFFARADPFVEFAKPVAVFRGNQVIDALADHGFGGRSAYHCQTR